MSKKNNKEINILFVSAYAKIVTSGYSDRYVMTEDLKVVIDLDGERVSLSAFSRDNALEQIMTIAEFSGVIEEDSYDQRMTLFKQLRDQFTAQRKVYIYYRDGNGSGHAETSTCIISEVINYFRSPEGNTPSTWLRGTEDALQKITRQELLGISQQMQIINVLIDAGLKKAEKVTFDWVPQ